MEYRIAALVQRRMLQWEVEKRTNGASGARQTAARPPEQDQRCAGRDGGALHIGGRQCPDRRDGSAAASGRCVPLDKVLAASHVINGFGKTTGLVQIDELGQRWKRRSCSPIPSVWVPWRRRRRNICCSVIRDICETTGSVNPVVCECNDSGLNDIRGLHVTEEHVFAALADCRADFAEGAVGAGRGMRCHGLKGGIGSASRQVAAGREDLHHRCARPLATMPFSA